MERALCQWSVTSASMSQCPAATCTATREERLALTSQPSGAPCSRSTVDISSGVPQHFFQQGLVREMYRRTRTSKYISERSPLPPTFLEPSRSSGICYCYACPGSSQPSRSRPSSELSGNLPRISRGCEETMRINMSHSQIHVCF